MTQKSNSFMLNLPAQAVLLLLLLVILITTAVGIPAILLLHEQLEEQAWKQAVQGSQMLSVLLDSRQNELQNLAIVTAQRPTLARLILDANPESLKDYLETFRAGANLDTVLLCSEKEELLQVGLDIPGEMCRNIEGNTTSSVLNSQDTTGWLYYFQPVYTDPTTKVLVAQAINESYASSLAEQIEMEVVFLSDGQILASSFEDSNAASTLLSPALGQSKSDPFPSPGYKHTLNNGDSYYVVQETAADSILETMVLLPAEPIIESQQRITRTGITGLLGVTLIGAVFAVFLTRRISFPLRRLQESALKLRKGDLDTPVTAPTEIRELAEVAYSLEDARVSLKHTLDRLRQEKAWGDYLLESVVEGIITLDRRCRITFFSRGAERITGLKQEQVLGSNIDEVIFLVDREHNFSDSIPDFGERHRIITILAENKTVTLAVSGARLAPPEADAASLALSIRDISNEEAMRGLLGEFLANITHEFRTPLTAQAASIELLLDQLQDLSHEEIRELLLSNHIGVISLQNLIDNLLEGASIEAGRFKVNPRPTDLLEVIQDVINTLHPLMDKKHQQLELAFPAQIPLVQADPRRTSQVLVNLLSNALKWGPSESIIYLAVEVSGKEVKVTVSDEGPGILPEEKQDLFIRFGHSQSKSGRAEYGAGLGLSVVKAIVESQAGRVGVEDCIEGGAVFWFTIPIAAVELKNEEPAS